MKNSIHAKNKRVRFANQMIGKIFFVVAIISIFLLAGCSSLGGGGLGSIFSSGSKNQIVYVDIYKGSEGLKAGFIDKAPPKIIYVSDSANAEPTAFNVMLSMENKGAADIKTGFVNLLVEKDILKSDDGNINTFRTFTLNGKTKEVPIGETKETNYLFYAKLDGNSQSKKTPINAVFCYDYATTATFSVCVDPDFINRKITKKACTVSDQSFSDQGAPVAITKIETRILTKENTVIPSFLIYIQNKGNGKVVSSESIKNACTSSAQGNVEWNVISAQAYLSERKLNCKPLPLHLRSNEDFIKCDLEEGLNANDPAYISPLTVLLTYGYTFTESTSVEVKRVQ